MESPTSNVKGSITSLFLLLPAASGVRHQALAVNRCHQFKSWQFQPLTEVSTQTASVITFQEVTSFLCRYREEHNKTGFSFYSAEISYYSSLSGSAGQDGAQP